MFSQTLKFIVLLLLMKHCQQRTRGERTLHLFPDCANIDTILVLCGSGDDERTAKLTALALARNNIKLFTLPAAIVHVSVRGGDCHKKGLCTRNPQICSLLLLPSVQIKRKTVQFAHKVLSA
jgi:hypothetical protein